MLTNLYIKNFALFNELSVDFDEDLNIISGETGSGKSILINAIALLKGGRINKNFIGKFSNETIVEASFSMDENLRKILLDNSIEPDDNIIISRRFTKSSSTVKLNNRPINLALLEEVSDSIFDIHGQHSQLVVMNKSNYIKIIDSFNTKTQDIKNLLAKNMDIINQLTDKLASIDLDPDQVLREIDVLEFQISEIESFDFSNFDEESLISEHKKLTNLTDIIQSIEKIKTIFTEGYQRTSLKDYINEIFSELSDISEFDKELEEFSSRIIDIRELVNELSRDIDSYSYSINLDEERLVEIDAIFSKIQLLKRKYGPEIEDIKAFYKTCKDRLDELKNIEELRNSINIEISKINKKNVKLADELTEIRKKIVKLLEVRIIDELSQMNMKNIEFKIEFDKRDSINENGQDLVDFMISTNKGQDMKSLNSVASGGEISRFMLALKAALADSEEVQTIIFDEIDTGISGMTADVVGDKLVNISKQRQVIVITHLPQIASKADSHYLIEKNIQEEYTVSKLTKLDETGRVKEVARLISGANITESTINSAQELIENAKR